MNRFHYLYTQTSNLKDMQDINRLKIVLIEQKKGGVHDVDILNVGVEELFDKKFLDSVSC